MTADQRLARLAPVFLVVLAILAGANAIDASPLGVFYDDAHYAILGRALAFGDGYRYLNIPGAPVGTHYPPGYPAFLALLWRIEPRFPENVALFKMANAVLLGGVALATYALARRRFDLSPLVAALAALAGTATIPALVLASTVMSETLLLVVVLPILLAAERGSENGVRTAAWLGLAVGAACLVRSHAVALIAALSVSYLVRRRWRDAVVSGAMALLVLAPWLLWVRHYDPLMPELVRARYGSYGAWFIDGLRADGFALLWAALRDNTVACLAIIARSFSLARHVVFDTVAVLAVLTLGLAGAADCWRRARVLLLFMAFYLAIALVWPFYPLRMVWGVWPLLVLLVVTGARWLWRLAEHPSRARTAARTASVAAGVVALAGTLAFNVRGYANAWWATPSRSMLPRVQPTIAWVAERSGPGDVIVADDEAAVWLYTGRRAVPANAFTARQFIQKRSPAENAAFLATIIGAFSPDYVVAWSVPTLEAARVLAAGNQPLLRQVDTIPSGRVYRSTRVTAAPTP